MAILFLKDAAKVVQCLKNIIGDCLKGHLVAKQIVSPEIEKAKKIISDFNNAEVEKMTNLVKHIE